ncbi:MAG: hypothetical protein A3E78_03550 [Alphaproteobacteria bacterium RIFCSPHIGHO2_12_FULL_63_12]|nr:MAG: hypothetical protein A3E78_03550 [Alphaproteobacteria bacterium RIFCSPHIGHO2_12_FULL_63_12]
MKKLIAVLVGAGVVLTAAPAFAGEWRLDARRCADLREDWRDARESRRDERYDYSRRDRVEDRYDRRESRRDRAVTVCPRSAFVYVSDRDHGRRGDDRRYDNARYDNDRYEHGRGDRGRKYGHGYREPKLKLSYDRRMGMQYTYDNGRRIYVRG